MAGGDYWYTPDSSGRCWSGSVLTLDSGRLRLACLFSVPPAALVDRPPRLLWLRASRDPLSLSVKDDIDS